MKSLSNIILEESIRAALTELETKKSKEMKKDDKSISTPKKDKWGRSIGDKWYGFNPKTKKWEFDKNDQSLHRQQALMIANKIYKSKRTWGDDEDLVVAAFTSIPNLATFYQVNNILKQNTGKSTSGYIRSFIDSDEVNVWIPLIKHLIKLNAPDKVVALYTNKADWDELKSKDSALAKKLEKKKSGLTDVSSSIDWTDPWNIAGLVLLALFVKSQAPDFVKKPFGWLWGQMTQIFRKDKKTINQMFDQPTLASVFELQTHLGAPKLWNKTRLQQLLRYEYSQGRITNEEYEQLIRVLKNVDRKKLNRIYFDLIVKALKRRIPGDVQAGSVRKLLVALDDAEFTKVWGPKLQAIEDDILSTKKATATPSTEKIKPNQLKYNVSLKNVNAKPNFKIWDMDRWIELQKKLGYDLSSDSQQHLRRISDIFKKNLNSQSDPEKAAKYAVDKYWKIKTSQVGSYIENMQRHSSDYWAQWITATKNGNRRYYMYSNLEEFPTYDRWKRDMEIVRDSKNTKLDYEIAKYNWLLFAGV